MQLFSCQKEVKILFKIITHKIFSNNLKNLRIRSNLTQSQLVNKMQLLGSQMSRSTYSMIEIGTRNIKVTDLVALKQVYGVDYAEFFKDIPTHE